MEELLGVNKPHSAKNTKRVLVVDDAAIMVRTLAGMLSNLGYSEVIRASNGVEAISLLEQYDFAIDLILSDWNMPKMNGLDLLEQVRTEPKSRAIPFIMVTANVDHEDVHAAVGLGVSAYLIKPFSQQMLKTRIDKALSTPIPRSLTKPIKTERHKSETNISEQKDFSVLVVDDEPNNIMVISELLKDKFRVQAARSGKKAIEICTSKNQPDLILLDIMMPELDGLAVCDYLKSNPSTEHIPIIFVSALSQTDDVVKGLTIGAVDYVTKPIIPEIFLARVDIHIKQLKHKRNLNQQIDSLMETMRLRDDIEKMFQHDLRSPLTAIYASIDSVMEKSPALENEASVIRQSTQVIQSMVDNQDAIYKLENKQYEITKTPILVAQFLKNILYGLKHKCMQQGVAIRYRISDALEIQGDKQLCYTLFSNLFNNAIDAAPEHSEVVVSASLTGANAIIITIKNDGMIPESIQPNFFDKFVTSGKQNGSGIGTYTAKLAVDAHKGSISFTSNKEKGTVLKIELPKK